MAIRPFANAPHADRTTIATNWLIGVQTGNTPNAVAEMKYLTFEEFTDYIKSNYGAMWRYRGESSSATPTDPEVNDYFICTGDFAEGGQSFAYGHVYAYNGNSWDDVSLVLNQYAQQSQVDDIDERLVVAEEKIDAMTGMVFKGDATRATLPTPAPSNQGWVYWLTDESIYVASDGTQWVTVMNYVVQTISEGDTSHAPSSDAVYKALAERDAKDADLQSQIVNTNAELDNVEALIGGDVEVENLDDTPMVVQSRLIHHANLLPNGSFGRVGARSVAFNQLMYNGNFSASNPLDGWGSGGSTISASGGVMTITPNSTNGQAYRTFSFLANHTYLLVADMKLSAANATTRAIIASPSLTLSEYCASNTSWQTITKILASPTAGTGYVIFRDDSSNSPFSVRNVNFFDLTTMNMTSLTADQFRSLFPASYYPNDTGHIYDLNPTGFRIRGINLWDEEWEVGAWNLTTGEKAVSSTNIRCKNKIAVSPLTTYFFMASKIYYALFYDANDNYIGKLGANGWQNGNTTFETPANCAYVAFYMYDAYGTSYNHDIQICDNSLPTAIKTTYHPSEHHTVDTPQISDGHYVNENCYDYVENVTEDGIVKGKKHTVVGSIDLGSLDWTKNQNRFYATISDAYYSSDNSINLLCEKYIAKSDDSQGYMWLYTGKIYIHDENYADASAFKTAMDGVYLYYELATETITDCEPLRSFGISDYATVEPITPQDELVNRIDVPYSVKTVSANTLIEQIQQNTADITNLNDALSAMDKRVENLEEAHGSYHEVDVKSVYTIPSGKGSNWIVDKLRGVSRVANQLVTNPSFATETDWIFSGCNHSVSNNILTITATAYRGMAESFVDMQNGHTYLLSAKVKLTTGNTSVRFGALRSDGNAWANYAFTQNTTNWQTISILFTLTGNDGNCLVILRDERETGWDAIQFADVLLTDLTQYFNGTIPSDADTIAEIQTNYPWLLTPSDYGTSGVNTVYEGIRSRFFNVWDEVWEVGGIGSGGVNNSETNRIRSKNLFPCLPNTSYFFQIPSPYQFKAFFYASDGTFISDSAGFNTARVETTPAGCFFMRFSTSASYGTTYNHDICVNISNVSLNGTYKPYREPVTLTFPSPISLKSAGAVAEEYYPETGRVTHPLGSVDLGSLNWTCDGTFLETYVTGKKIGINALLCTRYIVSYATYATQMVDGEIRGHANSTLVTVKDSSKIDPNKTNEENASAFKTAMNGVILYYELATPSPDTYVDPILNNLIATEPGGTIESILTNPVDDSMTLGYINL